MFGEQNDLKRDIVEFRKEFRSGRVKCFEVKTTTSNMGVNECKR